MHTCDWKLIPFPSTTGAHVKMAFQQEKALTFDAAGNQVVYCSKFG
jgi:hypothetical protein